MEVGLCTIAAMAVCSEKQYLPRYKQPVVHGTVQLCLAVLRAATVRHIRDVYAEEQRDTEEF